MEKVHIYTSETKQVLKSFNFSENVHSANFRDDGKMMCVGFDSNCVKVYPLLSDQKGVQDQFDGTDQAGDDDGDDKTASGANVPKKRALRTFDGHLG